MTSSRTYASQALKEARNRILCTAVSLLMATVGARSTPTFFINGRALVGAVPEAAFRVAIDEELKHAEQRIDVLCIARKRGVKRLRCMCVTAGIPGLAHA